MKAAGCFIIRGVIPTEVAKQEFEDLQAFIADNKETITGWPAKSVAIYHLYSSPTQLRLRTDPRHLKLQRLLNSLWGDTSCSPEELDGQYAPVLYPDALRIRAPGQEFLGLGPHIDAGSLSRWADDEYRRTYGAILSGNLEEYDPYDMTHRKAANPGMFPSGPHSSVLRTFQGWTALTPCRPGEGSLMLVPDIKTVTAYMILRPFFRAPEDGDWKDPEKWEIDATSAWFPGTYRWDSQLLSPASHPHLFLEDTLLSIPEMRPGDTVWWHADVSESPFPLQIITRCLFGDDIYLRLHRCAMRSKRHTKVACLRVFVISHQHHQHHPTSPMFVSTGKIWSMAFHLMTTSTWTVQVVNWC